MPTTTESRPKSKTFDYRALDADRQLRVGQVSSPNEAEVLERLRRMGLRPLEVKSARVSLAQRDFNLPGRGRKAKPGDLALFARQLATMVAAGVPLLQAVQVLSTQTSSPALKLALSDIGDAIESGESLSVAMARHDRTFDELFVSMVAAGESAGALDEVLRQLATTLERQVALRNKLRSALSYPIAVITLMFLIMAAMLTFVVPIFEDIYDQLGGTLPAPTRFLVAVSNTLRARLPIVAMGIVSAVWGVRRWKRSAHGRITWDRFKLRVPLFRRLTERAVLARLGRTLGVLTKSGIPILDALAITARTVRNETYAQTLRHTAEAVRRGEAIAPTLELDGVVPPMVSHLIAVGEQTGELDAMLDTIGGFYEDELDNAIASFTSIIEPLLMVVLGGTVGAMVVAMYLPMFKIIEYVK